VSIGGHDYRQDIRQGVFRFLNTHLKDDPRPVHDTERDLVSGNGEDQHPIAPSELRVFPMDENIPANALNGKIDEHFVSIATPDLPKSAADFAAWKNAIVAKLRDLTFHHFPERIPPAQLVRSENGFLWLRTEGNIEVRLKQPRNEPLNRKTIALVVANDPVDDATSNADYVLEPRGIGATRWTTKNPPNYVERSHYLLGRTVDSGRVWDIIAGYEYLKSQNPNINVELRGEGSAAVLAAYAALLHENIQSLSFGKMPMSLMEPGAPALLNALRVCEFGDVLGLLSDRNLNWVGGDSALSERTRKILGLRQQQP
jgi:hypothetical protein